MVSLIAGTFLHLQEFTLLTPNRSHLATNAIFHNHAIVCKKILPVKEELNLNKTTFAKTAFPYTQKQYCVKAHKNQTTNDQATWVLHAEPVIQYKTLQVSHTNRIYSHKK